jgi:hypothetical protein
VQAVCTVFVAFTTRQPLQLVSGTYTWKKKPMGIEHLCHRQRTLSEPEQMRKRKMQASCRDTADPPERKFVARRRGTQYVDQIINQAVYHELTSHSLKPLLKLCTVSSIPQVWACGCHLPRGVLPRGQPASCRPGHGARPRPLPPRKRRPAPPPHLLQDGTHRPGHRRPFRSVASSHKQPRRIRTFAECEVIIEHGADH